MSWVIIASVFWVFASAAVAMLPMRRQFYLGIPLFFLAPVLIIWLAIEYGWWIFFVALFAFLSMYRNPLRYFARRGWQRLFGPREAGE